MKFKNEKVNADQLYRVGYLPSLDIYVLAYVVTWIAWYERFYKITKEEYESYDRGMLNSLVNELRRVQNKSERFLFSEKIEENTKEQLLLYKKAQSVDSKDKE